MKINPSQADNFKTGVRYAKVGKDEWISMEDFMLKKDVIKLIDILGQIVVNMALKNVSENAVKFFLDQLRELKEGLNNNGS